MTTFVTIPFFFTGSEGHFDAVDLGGNSALVFPEKKSVNHLFVANLNPGMSTAERSHAIAEGMKSAHEEAKRHMASEFGDDWRVRASYSFGDIEFHEEMALTRSELEYLDS